MSENLIACPGVDVERFKRSCSVPLIAGEWNVWHIARTNVDGAGFESAAGDMSPLQAKTFGHLPGLRYVMRWWFKQLSPGPSVLTDDFDHLEIGTKRPETRLARFAHMHDRERLNCAPELITVKAGPNGRIWDFWVAFVYRGAWDSMPWPCYKTDDFGAVGFETWCPVQADFALIEAFRFEQKRPVPEKPSPTKGIIPKFVDPTQGIQGFLFWGAVAGVTIWLVSNTVTARIDRVI
jgi:hypothetical protein